MKTQLFTFGAKDLLDPLHESLDTTRVFYAHNRAYYSGSDVLNVDEHERRTGRVYVER